MLISDMNIQERSHCDRREDETSYLSQPWHIQVEMFTGGPLGLGWVVCQQHKVHTSWCAGKKCRGARGNRGTRQNYQKCVWLNVSETKNLPRYCSEGPGPVEGAFQRRGPVRRRVPFSQNSWRSDAPFQGLQAQSSNAKKSPTLWGGGPVPPPPKNPSSMWGGREKVPIFPPPKYTAKSLMYSPRMWGRGPACNPSSSEEAAANAEVAAGLGVVESLSLHPRKTHNHQTKQKHQSIPNCATHDTIVVRQSTVLGTVKVDWVIGWFASGMAHQTDLVIDQPWLAVLVVQPLATDAAQIVNEGVHFDVLRHASVRRGGSDTGVPGEPRRPSVAHTAKWQRPDAHRRSQAAHHQALSQAIVPWQVRDQLCAVSTQLCLVHEGVDVVADAFSSVSPDSFPSQSRTRCEREGCLLQNAPHGIGLSQEHLVELSLVGRHSPNHYLYLTPASFVRHQAVRVVRTATCKHVTQRREGEAGVPPSRRSRYSHCQTLWREPDRSLALALTRLRWCTTTRVANKKIQRPARPPWKAARPDQTPGGEGHRKRRENITHSKTKLATVASWRNAHNFEAWASRSSCSPSLRTLRVSPRMPTAAEQQKAKTSFTSMWRASLKSSKPRHTLNTTSNTKAFGNQNLFSKLCTPVSIVQEEIAPKPINKVNKTWLTQLTWGNRNDRHPKMRMYTKET